MAEDFGIKLEQEEQILDDFVSEQNENFLHLHEWQQEAINYFFNNNFKVIFEVTTGAGKTFCAIEIIKRLLNIDKKIYVLIVVPKNVILEEGWVKELRKEFNLQDVGVYYGFTKEICKYTVTNMQNLDKMNLEVFDFLILDECFDGDNKVLILDKNKKIKYKKLKDIVNKKLKENILSYNIKEKKLEYKKIINWYKIKEKREVFDIILENGEKITGTPEQLIFNGTKYIPINKLKKGDYLLTW